MRIPTRKFEPDKEAFRKVITGQAEPTRAHFIEICIDTEILEIISKEFGMTWPEGFCFESTIEDKSDRETALKNYIEFYHRLGFDCIRLDSSVRFGGTLTFPTEAKLAQDTASASRGKREWFGPSVGVINSWEDFERYPWPDAKNIDLWSYEFANNNLPEGMGLVLSFGFGVFDFLRDNFWGLENLSYLIYDNPALVEAVANRTGQIICDAYERIAGLDNLVGFFQCDDMGFKTGPLVSPDFLRKYILPWHKKTAQIAHGNDLLYILHSCGNIESVMEDLIEDVKIDAKHSFEDQIMPVAEFKKKYGDRIGTLGGVDMDKLCRLEEKELRSYIRNILDECMPGGGYALGSGNTVANYVPVENFLIMIDEGMNWKP